MRDDRRKVSPTAGPSTAERRVGPTDRRRGTPPTGLDRGRSSGLDGLRAFACLLNSTETRTPTQTQARPWLSSAAADCSDP